LSHSLRPFIFYPPFPQTPFVSLSHAFLSGASLLPVFECSIFPSPVRGFAGGSLQCGPVCHVLPIKDFQILPNLYDSMASPLSFVLCSSRFLPRALVFWCLIFEILFLTLLALHNVGLALQEQSSFQFEIDKHPSESKPRVEDEPAGLSVLGFPASWRPGLSLPCPFNFPSFFSWWRHVNSSLPGFIFPPF